jgi:hypothetical protein
MQGTCEKEKCKIWQLLDGSCPNYVETWWTPPPLTPGPPVLVADCAPKRMLIMIQELSNRLVGVEKSQEEARNETIWVQAIAALIGKNSGLNIEAFVEEKIRLERVKQLPM